MQYTKPEITAVRFETITTTDTVAVTASIASVQSYDTYVSYSEVKNTLDFNNN